MASRRLNQSAWGLSSSRDFSTGRLVAIAAVTLVVGILLGYVVRGGGDSTANPAGNVPKEVLDNSAVIDPSIAAMSVATQTEDGAVKAATSLVSGFVELVLRTPAERTEVVNSIVDPNADPAVAQQMLNLLNVGQSRFIPQVGTTTAKVITTPVSYKVEALAEGQAKVTLWYNTIYVDAAGSQFQSTWSTAVVTMRFLDTWKISNFVSTEGPTPPQYNSTAQPDTYNDVVPILQNAFAYRYALAR